jgi:hypothetical protein
MGLGLEAGLDVAFGSGTLMIGVRRTLGLQSVYRLEASVVISDSSPGLQGILLTP